MIYIAFYISEIKMNNLEKSTEEIVLKFVFLNKNSCHLDSYS